MDCQNASPLPSLLQHSAIMLMTITLLLLSGASVSANVSLSPQEQSGQPNNGSGGQLYLPLITGPPPLPLTGRGVEWHSHISGPVRSIEVGGNYLYIGSGIELLVMDIADPLAPVPAGSLTLPGIIGDMVVSGNYVYIIEYWSEGGMRVIDVSDPAQPKMAGIYRDLNSPSSLDVAGQYVYVADSNNGMHIVDVSNPTSPRMASIYRAGNEVQIVKVMGERAYVAIDGALQVVGISDPSRPVELGYPHHYGWFNNLAVDGNIVYLAGYNSVSVVDVGDPAAHRLLHDFAISTTGDDIAIYEEYLILSDRYEAAIRIVDRSTPTNLKEIGVYSVPGSPGQVAVMNSLFYVVHQRSAESGVHAVDLSNPMSPTGSSVYHSIGEVKTVDMAISNARVYLAERNGLRIVDVTDEKRPSQTSFSSGVSSLKKIEVVSDHAYILSGDEYGYYTSSFHAADVSNPEEPVWTGAVRVAQGLQDMAIVGKHAYVVGSEGCFRACWPGGFYVIDISAPESPEVVFYDESYDGSSIVIHGNFAYIGHANGLRNQLRILDISVPDHPLNIGEVSFSDGIQAFEVDNGYGYIVTDSLSLQIFDWRDPSHPIEIATFSTRTSIEDVALSGSYAFLASSVDGLRILDISDPSHPLEVAYYRTPGEAYSVRLFGNFIYVISRYNGVDVHSVSILQFDRTWPFQQFLPMMTP